MDSGVYLVFFAVVVNEFKTLLFLQHIIAPESVHELLFCSFEALNVIEFGIQLKTELLSRLVIRFFPTCFN